MFSFTWITWLAYIEHLNVFEILLPCIWQCSVRWADDVEYLPQVPTWWNAYFMHIVLFYCNIGAISAFSRCVCCRILLVPLSINRIKLWILLNLKIVHQTPTTLLWPSLWKEKLNKRVMMRRKLKTEEQRLLGYGYERTILFRRRYV